MKLNATILSKLGPNCFSPDPLPSVRELRGQTTED